MKHSISQALRYSLAVIAVAGVGLVTGCGDEESGGSNTTADEIQQKEEQWNALGIRNYTMAYRVECICPTKRVTVQVENGVIVRNDFDTGDPGDLDRDDYLFTVPKLFDRLRDANRNAHFVFVKYSGEMGYPFELRIDDRDNNIDDVETITITRLDIS